MRYKATWLLIFAASLVLGCGQRSADTDEPDVDVPVVELGAEEDDAADDSSGANELDESADSSDVSDSSTINLTPQNTTIGFVGTHVVDDGPDPNARPGQFSEFSGAATITDGALTEVSVEIETSSLQTKDEKLTGHLKSPDFFDVREHPQASFASTSIEPVADGELTITGDLTLLGNTKSISFPAAVSIDDGLSLTAEFTIDRTEFGMDYGDGKVEKAVAMSIEITKS